MINKTITFEIDCLPCSVNNAVRVTHKGGYKTKAYKQWYKAVSLLKPQKIVDSQWYGVELFLYFPIYNKGNGKGKRKDVSNYIKYAEDGFFRLLTTYDGKPIDDSRIRTGTYEKVNSEEIKTVFTVYAIE